MRNVLLAIALTALFLTGCAEAKWNVVHQIKGNFVAHLAGFRDENTGLTVGPGGQCFFTANGGVAWDHADNRSFCRFGLEIVNDQAAVHCGNAGQVGFSSDGGKSWKLVADFGDVEPNQCRYLSFPDEKTGWIASPQRLAVTVDKGSAWRELTLPPGAGSVMAISLWAADHGCLLDNNFDLYFTGDGGKTWQRQKVQVATQGIARNISLAPNTAMRFRDENNGVIICQVVAGKESKLVSLGTSDGGKTWTEEPIPVKTAEESALFLSRDTKFLTVFNKTDGIIVIKTTGV
jgi:photosystem II stability/assembly factor-like uncharacterized protein